MDGQRAGTPVTQKATCPSLSLQFLSRKHKEEIAADEKAEQDTLSLRNRKKDHPQTPSSSRVAPQRGVPPPSLPAALAEGLRRRRATAPAPPVTEASSNFQSREKHRDTLGHSPLLNGREITLGSWVSMVDVKRYTADVLLVDDNSMCQLAGSLALKRLGLSVEVSPDGDAAVARFVEKKERFRLVLMDRNMPKLEGPPAIKAIINHLKEKEKEKERSGRSPTAAPDSLPLFVGLTGQTEESEASLEAGATDILLKPVTTEKLQNALMSLNFDVPNKVKQSSREGSRRGSHSGGRRGGGDSSAHAATATHGQRELVRLGKRADTFSGRLNGSPFGQVS
uniref:Response regulatory domain-containing protein n=1 Tax=Chromera velia CCMP2878 TaxID=1169474 RepID=A0A0G4HZR7_9ALVE|eukprot:Cvel_9790.t1-p1 / transcript=Cvel_9790.t1 / gene=Cvel_9790 / organism=Chromera_velia_CCMP2878 / gene_product=hypothetical protein / transcript_product=hypothetical protein / location=Cvel_scaffold574:55383-56393(-) / protein_length=337 / sequence_SO=supercontig / SO=protein_coding / is_pseudo=false